MPTDVSICNRALSQIRAENINALDEGSYESETCRLVYDDARRSVLREFPWRFATQTKALALLGTDDETGWTYKYDYPNDAVRLLNLFVSGIGAQKNGIAYSDPYAHVYGFDKLYPNALDINELYPYETQRRNGARVILTDVENAYARYVADVTTPDEYDPLFVDALVWRMAFEIAVPIMGNERGRSLRSDALTMYRAAVAEAQRQDRSERSRVQSPESEFITTR